MATEKKKRKRDIQKDYPAKQFVQKLRRLADSIEQGRKFQIQVAGERIMIPSTATINTSMSAAPRPKRWNSSSRG